MEVIDKLEEVLEQEIHLHLPNLVTKLFCPSYGGEIILYLSRQKFEREEGKVDLKYYYNCNKGLECADRGCIFRRSVEIFSKEDKGDCGKIWMPESSKSF